MKKAILWGLLNPQGNNYAKRKEIYQEFCDLGNDWKSIAKKLKTTFKIDDIINFCAIYISKENEEREKKGIELNKQELIELLSLFNIKDDNGNKIMLKMVTLKTDEQDVEDIEKTKEDKRIKRIKKRIEDNTKDEKK